MNILYILQQSIYNNENKWISADSNINMLVGILTEIVEKINWTVYILIAPLKDFADIKSYDNIFKHKNVIFIPYTYPIDAFTIRQHFNIIEFDSIFKELPKIDIVWNNIIELSRNIKTYLFQKSKETKLISCCYWMDTPEINEAKVATEISYQYRQFDGYECSDLCIFTCKSTKEAFFNNAKLVFKSNKINQIKKKSFIWDFGFSKKEADTYKLEEKFEKKTILFLNRLSGINYTHHIEFIEAVNKLYEKRKDFQVIFTNPSGKYSIDELKELVKPLYIYKEGSLNRQEYFELLWKADISFHGFILERMGGCSQVESLYCNNITIMPMVFEYARRGGKKYPYYINHDGDSPIVDSIVQKLNYALDSLDYINTNEFKEIKIRNNQGAFEYISDKVIKDIEGLFLYES